MRIILVSIVLAVCCSCRPMTNEEIVRETKFCEQNGMIGKHLWSDLAGGTSRVECRSKEDK